MEKCLADIPDDELLKRIVRKDEQAFLALYDRYASRVYALTLRILQDAQLAEEATQDTFFKCWSRARSFLAERGAFAPWLLTIARNTALDRLRLDKRHPILTEEKDPEDTWERLPDEGSQGEEHRWRSLYFILQSLPKENRIAIELAFYQGMSHSEIAETLGWPLGTVKTRIRLGMDQIRQQWFKDEAAEPETKSSLPDV
jgi:RNA polymerase sigma-70 factor (ECF subfamily)